MGIFLYVQINLSAMTGVEEGRIPGFSNLGNLGVGVLGY